MSRSAAKSRADNRGRRPSVQAITPIAREPGMEDIVPGRLTQAHWLDMLWQEDAEDIVGEIMEELLSRAMESWFNGYIQKQLVLFSTSWAKGYLVQVLEWQFLYRDEGEGPEEASRTEDSEPLPVTTDSWAQGCVPVIHTTPPPHPAPQQGSESGKPCHVVAKMSSSPEQPGKERRPNRPSDYRSYRVLTPTPPPKSDGKRRRPICSLPKIVAQELLRSPRHLLSRSAKEEKEDEKRIHSFSTHRFESLNQHEDNQPIPRLDYACLPRHCVLPQYEIVDTYHSKHHPKRPSGRPLPEQRRHRQEPAWAVHTLKPLTNYLDKPTKLQRRNAQSEADFWLSSRKNCTSTGHEGEGVKPFSGPLRLDTMDLAQGVSLKDAQRVQSSPHKLCPPVQLKQITELRPMQSNRAMPLFSVEQLTTGSPPQVTPLH